MIFLFEEHLYDSVFLKAVIGYGKGEIKYRSESGFNTEKTNDGIKINGVGYCFYNGQPVFVLPIKLDLNMEIYLLLGFYLIYLMYYYHYYHYYFL